MKKMAALLAATVLIAAGSIACGAENGGFGISGMSENGVTLSYTGNEEYTIYVARYSGAELKKVEAVRNDTVTVTTNSEDDIKAFCWGGEKNVTPLGDSISLHMCKVAVSEIASFDSENASFTTETATYKISEDYSGFINMTEMELDTVSSFIASLEENKHQLGDYIYLYDTNSDNEYDEIYMERYGTAVVYGVVMSGETAKKITFVDQSGQFSSSLDLTRDDAEYSFTMDGESIEPEELTEGDVLTIKSNPYNFRDSAYYDVTVTRNTANGYCTEYNSTAHSVKIGNREYEINEDFSYLGLEEKRPYTVLLDDRGRIVYESLDYYSMNLGIVYNISEDNGKWYMSVIDKHGDEQKYLIDEDNASVYAVSDEYCGFASWPQDDNSGMIYKDEPGCVRLENYPNLLMEMYYDEQTGYYEIVNKWDYLREVERPYKPSTKKLGAYIVDEKTAILDISDVNNGNDKIKAMTYNDLDGKHTYTAYVYLNSDVSQPIILITSTEAAPDEPVVETAETTKRMGIFKSSTTVIENETEKTQYTVLDEGEQKAYIVSSAIAGANTFSEGDAFIFDTDVNGEISEINPIFSADNMLGSKTFAQFSAAVAGDIQGILSHPSGTYWENLMAVENGDASDVLFGVVTAKENNSIRLATSVENGKYVNLDTALQLITNNAIVYTYNFGARAGARIDTDTGIYATYAYNSAKTTNAKGQQLLDITAEDQRDDVVYAAMRVTDYEVKELYLIVYDL